MRVKEQCNTKISSEIERMERNESQCLSAAIIIRINGNTRSSQGLSEVISSNNEGVEVEIRDHIQMETALLHAYAVNITQANTTTCMTSLLKKNVGPCVKGKRVNDILLEGGGGLCLWKG